MMMMTMMMIINTIRVKIHQAVSFMSESDPRFRDGAVAIIDRDRSAICTLFARPFQIICKHMIREFH